MEEKIIQKIIETVGSLKEEIPKANNGNKTAILNVSSHIGKYHALLNLLDLDKLVEMHEKYSQIVEDGLKAQENIYK